MTVALVRFEPVPPPDAPPGISRSQRSKLEELKLARRLNTVFKVECTSSESAAKGQEVSTMSSSLALGDPGLLIESEFGVQSLVRQKAAINLGSTYTYLITYLR